MQTTTKENNLGFLNLLIVVLSIYVLISLIVDTFFKLPTEISRLIFYTDNALCAVFLYGLTLYQVFRPLVFLELEGQFV